MLTYDDTANDELRKTVCGANEDGANSEADVADNEHPLAADPVRELLAHTLADVHASATYLSEYVPPKNVPIMAPTLKLATAHCNVCQHLAQVQVATTASTHLGLNVIELVAQCIPDVAQGTTNDSRVPSARGRSGQLVDQGGTALATRATVKACEN